MVFIYLVSANENLSNLTLVICQILRASQIYKGRLRISFDTTSFLLHTNYEKILINVRAIHLPCIFLSQVKVQLLIRPLYCE